MAALVLHFNEHFLLLLTWKDAASTIGKPYEHVVVEAEMKTADHFCALSALEDSLLNKIGDLLDKFVQVHGGTPLVLVGRQYLRKQVPTVCQRWRTKSCLCHDQGWLEGELVSQQNVEVEFLNRGVQLGLLGRDQDADRSFVYLKLKQE